MTQEPKQKALSSGLEQLDPSAQKAVIDRFGDDVQVRIVKTFSAGNSGAAVCQATINSSKNPEQDYVVRVINQGYALQKKYHPLVDSVVRSETYANRRLADAGIGAELYNYNPKKPPGALISECVSGRALKNEDFNNPNLHKQFIALLRQLHTLNYDESQLHEWTLIQRVQFHIGQLMDKQENLSPDLKMRLDAINNTMEIMSLEKSEVCMIHGDLRLNNIFLTEEGGMKFIDLTDISRGDPMEDLASLADSLGYDDEKAMTLLEDYEKARSEQAQTTELPRKWMEGKEEPVEVSDKVQKRFKQAQALVQLRRGVWLLSTVVNKKSQSEPLELPESKALTDIPKAERPGYGSVESKIQLAAACITDFEQRMGIEPPAQQHGIQSK